MEPVTTAALIGAGAQTANGVLGMIGQKKREERAVENQRKLMGIQFGHQKQLDKYGQELQLDTWKKTNYPAQVAMLKEAGLNPALLYGNGGSGGVTGSQGGGSAASGSAPAPQPWPLDIGQSIMMAANIKLMQAQAKKTNAEANVIEQTGIPEAETRISEAGYRMENIKAVTENEKAKNALIKAETEWQNIQNNIASQSAEGLIKQVYQNNEKLANEIRISLAQAKVAENTIDSAIQKVYLETVKQAVEIELTKQNILLAEGQTRESWNRAQAILTHIVQNWTALNQEQQKIDISKMLAEFNTNTPSHIGQWTGILGNILSGAKQATSISTGGGTVVRGFGN